MLDSAAANSSKVTHALGEQGKVDSVFAASWNNCDVAF
jgi:hypothetical protein